LELKNIISKDCDVSFANLLILDEYYIYSIVNEIEERSSIKESGFFIQSINTIRNKVSASLDLTSSFKLKTALGGRSNILEYFMQEDRVVMQSDFQSVKIFPILHRNSISTLGMKPWDSYLSIRRFDD
jgi:hypothetical protein